MSVMRIPQVTDSEDRSGARCNVLSETGLRCHRRLGHSDNTKAVYILDDGTEQVVVFNHRSVMGGTFFTW